MPALRRAPGARSLSAVLGGPFVMTGLTPQAVGRPGSDRSWGRFGWARWLPEVVNAGIVALVLACTVSSLVPLTDAELRGSALDIYEGSAWNLIGLCVFATVGAVAAVGVYWASESARRKRLAAVQIAIIVVCVAASAFGHLRVMRRITQLTGQTFGGFP